MQRNKTKSLSQQMKEKVSAPALENEDSIFQPYTGNFETVISTGSTRLDLAISGKRIRGGGLPGGVFIEVAGPSQSGKTGLLCEVAGAVIRQGGDAQFNDPEGRLDEEWGLIFDMKIDKKNYHQPDTVTEVFGNIRNWIPKEQPDLKKPPVHVILADSLAALSTDMEMENDEGDKMGGRRGKEFSEQLRKTCRLIKRKNYILIASNQLRQNMNVGPYGQKYTSPGGEAIKFYSSIRLRFSNPVKITKTIKVAGNEIKEVVGIETEVEVIKTVDSPYRKAKITIRYGYGIDDIHQNLQYIKDYTTNTTYCVGERKLSNSIEEAIKIVEKEGLEEELRNEVINLWENIERQFEVERKPKY